MTGRAVLEPATLRRNLDQTKNLGVLRRTALHGKYPCGRPRRRRKIGRATGTQHRVRARRLRPAGERFVHRVRLGQVANRLVEGGPHALRLPLRQAGLLSRDPRMKERKKYGQRGARARFQYSKR